MGEVEDDDTRLFDMLEETFGTDGARIWLVFKHEQFGGLTVDEMRRAGRFQEVLAAAERLYTGAVH